MKPITLEWVSKAEDDWKVAQREFRARKGPSYDAVCFHSQQCAEKYLKGRLEEAGLAFGKTHNLVALLALVLQVEPLWLTLHPRLNALNSFAVAYRYPGASATKTNARDAFERLPRSSSPGSSSVRAFSMNPLEVQDGRNCYCLATNRTII